MITAERPDPGRLLAELWAQDEPPAFDPAFVIAAMERAERQRLRFGLAGILALTLLVGLMSWALAPVVAAAAQSLRLDPGSVGVLAAAGAMALFLWSWASDRLQPLQA